MEDQDEITEILNNGVAKKMELRNAFHRWLDDNPDSNIWNWINQKFTTKQSILKLVDDMIKDEQAMIDKFKDSYFGNIALTRQRALTELKGKIEAL